MTISFEIDGLDEFKKELLQMASEFPEEKEKELKKIGLIAESQIKPLIPVDTGRMRNSVFNHVLDINTSEIVVPTDYAEAVNNGHLTRGGKSFVKGVGFVEKGLQNAEPQIYEEVDRWLNGLFKK